MSKRDLSAFVIFYKENIWANVLLALLAVFSVSLLVYEFSVSLSPEQVRFIHLTDIFIACLFLLDFLIGWWAYPKKKQYWKENWTDLVASIPVSGEVYRSFRFLRILRLLRVVRILQIRRLKRATGGLSDENARYLYLVITVITFILAGAIAFFTLEVRLNPDVDNFYDAIWWTVSTATVGYGDIYPVTWEGRLVGIFLMLFGVALVGTIAGFVGSHIFTRSRWGKK